MGAQVGYRNEARFDITTASADAWKVQLQHEVSLVAGEQYTLCYSAKADQNRSINVNIDLGRAPYTSLTGGGKDEFLTTSYQHYVFTFAATASESKGRLTFNLGESAIDVQLDNIGIYAGSQCPDNGGDTVVDTTPAPRPNPNTGGNGSSGTPESMINQEIAASSFDPDNAFSYRIANNNVEYFNGGSYVCYNNINLTGVNSIDVNYARNNPHDRPSRLGIYIDDPSIPKFKNTFFDITKEQYLGERNTVGTGSWSTFRDINVGITPVSGEHTLCLVGITGGGVGNLKSLTFRAEQGISDGRLDFTFNAPKNAPQVEKITTQGNQVLFDGQAKSLAGVSFFWGSNFGEGEYFYNAQTVKSLKDNWGVNLVRAAIGVEESEAGILNDYFAHKKRAYDVANAAIENGMYVILDWHTHHAEDYENDAIDFFEDMATKFGEYDNVIYEIYNEPLESSKWKDDVKPYAERVIAAIRAIDPDNLIIVGSPTWSQDVDVAAKDPIADNNLAYTLHFYAGSHKEGLRDKAQTALDLGVPLFVTEWGMTPASGDGALAITETDIWMDFLKERNISHVVWSISDFEGSSIFKPGVAIDGSWGDADLSEGGEKAKEIIINW